MTEKEISVVIPTFNRRRSLEAVLKALSVQVYPEDLFEVIVIDDGSTDDTSKIVDRQFPFQLSYLKQRNQGATVARNLGAEQSVGKILLFLDDDISVVPEFLNELHRIHGAFDRIVLVGNLQGVYHNEASVFQKIAVDYTSTPRPTGEAVMEEINFVDCLSGILSVKRNHYFEIGMHKDVAGDGRVAWGDVDFGYRAYCLGFIFYRAYNAIGFHDDFSIQSLEIYKRRWQEASAGAAKLINSYPEIADHLPMFLDKDPIKLGHDRYALIIRKLARKIASSPPLTQGMEKTVEFLERYYPSTRLLKPLYRWIIGSYIFRGYRDGLRRYGPIRR